MVELPISYLCGSIYSTQQQKQKQGHHWDTVFPSVQKLPSNLHPIRVCVHSKPQQAGQECFGEISSISKIFRTRSQGIGSGT